MINLVNVETSYQDLARYELIAQILAKELPHLPLLSEPLDIIDSIESISGDMVHMPEIIQDCREAAEAFDQLDQTIDHMYALADRAVELGEGQDAKRMILDEEFKGYAHIVARLAGADDWNGPRLSLATLPEATSARQILGYLSFARQNFTKRLADQRRQINQAMNEALEVLSKIATESAELSHVNKTHLQELIDRLSAISENFTPAPSVPQKWLH